VSTVHAHAVHGWARAVVAHLPEDANLNTCFTALGYRFDGKTIASIFGTYVLEPGRRRKSDAVSAVVALEQQRASEVIRQVNAPVRSYESILTVLGSCLFKAAPGFKASIETLALFSTGIDCEINLKPVKRGKRRIVEIVLDSSIVMSFDTDDIVTEMRRALEKAGVNV
jgi:hypothetical protein